ncbi:MAG: phage virion morphogenesis protein, partial [Planctomycetota bacterium]
MGASEVRVSPGLRKMLKAMKDMDMKKLGLWRPVVNQFTAAVSTNFEAEGRPSWPPLKTKYSAKKHATFTLTGRRRTRPPARTARRHPILQLSGDLRKAASGTRAKGFRKAETARTLTMSITGIPYAARHNFGYRGGQGRGRA